MEAAGSAKIRILEARYYLIALNGKYVDQSHIFLFRNIYANTSIELFYLQCYLFNQAEHQNHVNVSWNQLPEMISRLASRLQVLRKIFDKI